MELIHHFSLLSHLVEWISLDQWMRVSLMSHWAAINSSNWGCNGNSIFIYLTAVLDVQIFLPDNGKNEKRYPQCDGNIAAHDISDEPSRNERDITQNLSYQPHAKEVSGGKWSYWNLHTINLLSYWLYTHWGHGGLLVPIILEYGVYEFPYMNIWLSIYDICTVVDITLFFFCCNLF